MSKHSGRKHIVVPVNAMEPDGESFVFDPDGEPVLTGLDQYYMAPRVNAQFVADRLNKRGDWSKTG